MIDADVTILGAGPTGSALALLLARSTPDPARIRLCRVPSPGRPADQPAEVTAARTLALNHGSRVLLEGLAAWPDHGAAIHTIHVSQRGRLGRTLIQHTDFNVPELGTVHPYDRVVDALNAAVAQSGVTVQEGEPAAVVREDNDAVHLAQNDRLWASRVVVQAEGSRRPITGVASAGTHHSATLAPPLERHYQQHAILGLIQASAPRPGWAWERFTREGPLALLPVRVPGHAADNTYSLVWCCAPEQATQRAQANDARFATELQQAFGHRLGGLLPLGPRQVQPLRLRWHHKLLAGRRVLIGNAAQTLHPVAGQGLNLGLRDAAQLAQHLGPWLTQPEQDPRAALEGFAQRRRNDRLLTGAVTDVLPRIFSTGLAPIEHACGLALMALDTLPGLRRPLAQHLMLGLRS